LARDGGRASESCNSLFCAGPNVREFDKNPVPRDGFDAFDTLNYGQLAIARAVSFQLCLGGLIEFRYLPLRKCQATAGQPARQCSALLFNLVL